jgi:pimeloyl-ACP methyl ester carboxylesterase
MELQNMQWTDHSMSGRITRRRFLAGIAAVGLMPPAAAAATTPIETQARGVPVMTGQIQAYVTTDYLNVPGARLYYAVSGSGPTVLLIPGGPVDADGWLPMLGALEEHFTMVRYDPRGISRSRLEDPEAVSVETHADDAARLLQAIGGKPVFVLGHSGGGVIGLALVEGYPELVETFVAHEPPLVELLPEDDPRRTAGEAIYETYQQHGVEAAMAQFMGAAGMDGEEQGPPADMSPEALEVVSEAMARTEQNLDFFIAHYLLPITSYEPDFAALKEAPTRVEVGVGEASVGQETYDTALALAERLGTDAVMFPGDHVGMAAHPEAFAEKLRGVFQAQ